VSNGTSSFIPPDRHNDLKVESIALYGHSAASRQLACTLHVKSHWFLEFHGICLCFPPFHSLFLINWWGTWVTLSSSTLCLAIILGIFNVQQKLTHSCLSFPWCPHFQQLLFLFNFSDLPPWLQLEIYNDPELSTTEIINPDTLFCDHTFHQFNSLCYSFSYLCSTPLCFNLRESPNFSLSTFSLIMRPFLV